MVYAYAAIQEVCLTPAAPRLLQPTSPSSWIGRRAGVPGTGKDFKTGQTLMKTIIAPGLKARMFVGWYSTNILGNRDG